jgi:hypothetical protein
MFGDAVRGRQGWVPQQPPDHEVEQRRLAPGQRHLPGDVACLPEPGGGDRAPDVGTEEELQPDRAQRHHVEVDLEQGAEPAGLQLPALGEGDVEPVEQDPDREAGVQQRLVGELQELVGRDEAGQPLSGGRLSERDPRAHAGGKPGQGVDVQGGLERLGVHEPARVLPGGSDDRAQHDQPARQQAGVVQGRPHLSGRLALDLVLDQGLAEQYRANSFQRLTNSASLVGGLATRSRNAGAPRGFSADTSTTCLSRSWRLRSRSVA